MWPGALAGLSCFCRAETLHLDVGSVSVVSTQLALTLATHGVRGSTSPSKRHQRTTLNLNLSLSPFCFEVFPLVIKALSKSAGPCLVRHCSLFILSPSSSCLQTVRAAWFLNFSFRQVHQGRAATRGSGMWGELHVTLPQE